MARSWGVLIPGRIMQKLSRNVGVLALSLLAVAGLASACDPPLSVEVNASFACVDPGVPPNDEPTNWTTKITANTLERCILAGDTLSFGTLDGTDFFRLAIVGLTGPGKYTANADADDGTFVSLRAHPGADGTKGTTTDVGTSSGECPATCTIEVTEASVTEAPVGETGSFVATVTCPKLSGAGVGCVTCKPSGPVATISIPECEHPE